MTLAREAIKKYGSMYRVGKVTGLSRSGVKRMRDRVVQPATAMLLDIAIQLAPYIQKHETVAECVERLLWEKMGAQK